MTTGGGWGGPNLQYVTRVITRVAGLIGNVPCQYGGVITVHHASQAVLTQYNGCYVVLVLGLQCCM